MCVFCKGMEKKKGKIHKPVYTIDKNFLNSGNYWCTQFQETHPPQRLLTDSIKKRPCLSHTIKKKKKRDFQKQFMISCKGGIN